WPTRRAGRPRLRHAASEVRWGSSRRSTHLPHSREPPRTRANRRFYVRLFQQRVNGMNARARDLGIDGRVTFEELLAVFETCGWKCVGCGSERDLHADHVIPMKEGGRI